MSGRTYAMHFLMRIGLEKVVVLYWKLIGRPIDYLQGSRADRFRAVYREHRWSGRRADRSSLSGMGSTLPATRSIRGWLPDYLPQLGTGTLLDLGCGDYFWMKEVELPCAYLGVDIVEDVIARNQELYGDARHRFLVLDAVEQPLPPADTILCREVLFHLDLADGVAAIANMRRSGVKYLLATTVPDVRFNPDVPTGAFREVNLAIAPYNLGEPVDTKRDGDGANERRVIGVWRI